MSKTKLPIIVSAVIVLSVPSLYPQLVPIEELLYRAYPDSRIEERVICEFPADSWDPRRIEMAATSDHYLAVLVDSGGPIDTHRGRMAIPPQGAILIISADSLVSLIPNDSGLTGISQIVEEKNAFVGYFRRQNYKMASLLFGLDGAFISHIFDCGDCTAEAMPRGNHYYSSWNFDEHYLPLHITDLNRLRILTDEYLPVPRFHAAIADSLMLILKVDSLGLWNIISMQKLWYKPAEVKFALDWDDLYVLHSRRHNLILINNSIYGLVAYDYEGNLLWHNIWSDSDPKAGVFLTRVSTSKEIIVALHPEGEDLRLTAINFRGETIDDHIIHFDPPILKVSGHEGNNDGGYFDDICIFHRGSNWSRLGYASIFWVGNNCNPIVSTVRGFWVSLKSTKNEINIIGYNNRALIRWSGER